MSIDVIDEYNERCEDMLEQSCVGIQDLGARVQRYVLHSMDGMLELDTREAEIATMLGHIDAALKSMTRLEQMATECMDSESNE